MVNAMRTKIGNGHNLNLEQFLEDIKVVVKDGEELLKASMTGVKERALAGARTTNGAVRGHPYQSLGIIFGLGVLIGVIAAGAFSHQGGMEAD
jgi:ElaB/YqjD/DUF883 family membrane-anchored ribosome-binding protein